MAFSSDGRKWGGSKCELDISLPCWPSAWQNTANTVINTWNGATSKFSFAALPGSQHYLAAHDLGQWNGWLAMTYTRPKTASSLLTGAEVLINLHYEWDPAHPIVAHTDTGGPYDLESVLLHEFGHLLHLNDEPTALDVMQPTILPNVIRNRLGQDDVAGISHIYPMLSDFNLPRLVRQADAIVECRVTHAAYATLVVGPIGSDEGEIRSRQGQFMNLVFTVHRIDLLRPYKMTSRFKMLPPIGAGPSSFDLLTLGGETPAMSLDAEGEAKISPGEEVLLFLTRDYYDYYSAANKFPRNRMKVEISQSRGENVPRFDPARPSFSVLGGFQGKYTIYRRGETEYAWRAGTPRGSEDPALRNLTQQISQILNQP